MTVVPVQTMINIGLHEVGTVAVGSKGPLWTAHFEGLHTEPLMEVGILGLSGKTTREHDHRLLRTGAA